MKIAFLADPLSGFKIYKDSTFAMMREAARRGHRIYAFEQRHLVLDQGVVTAEATEITLTGDPDDWYAEGEVATVPLSARSNPAAMRSAVVLPQPLGPRRLISSPGWTSRSIASSATFAPNVLRTRR